MNRRTKILKSHLNKIEEYIPYFETKNLNVSKASIGWQLDHALKVVNGVLVILLWNKGFVQIEDSSIMHATNSLCWIVDSSWYIYRIQ